MRNRMRLLSSMIAATAIFATLAQEAQAQALDVTGTWTLEVTSQNGTTSPTLTLRQNGTALTGSYTSTTLGDHDVTGSVAGRNVTVNFTAEIEGLGEAPLSYAGSVNESGIWSGELVADVQGQPFPIGTFTATKSGQ